MATIQELANELGLTISRVKQDAGIDPRVASGTDLSSGQEQKVRDAIVERARDSTNSGSGSNDGTNFWQWLAIVVLGIMLLVALVGMGFLFIRDVETLPEREASLLEEIDKLRREGVVTEVEVEEDLNSTLSKPTEEAPAVIVTGMPEETKATAIQVNAVDEAEVVIEMPPDPVETITQGEWKIALFEGATNQMESWSQNMKDLDPLLWSVFPNVDHEGYPAANGLEYGMDESVFGQDGQEADFQVAARHYRLFTGDYALDEINECTSEDGIGCAVAVFNVGDVTSVLSNQHLDRGFTVTGRYWNGDVMPHAIWALMSHAAANMLNLDTFAGDETLNMSGRTNAGANCSVPGACIGVELTFAVTSGNQVLMVGTTTVER